MSESELDLEGIEISDSNSSADEDCGNIASMKINYAEQTKESELITENEASKK